MLMACRLSLAIGQDSSPLGGSGWSMGEVYNTLYKEPHAQRLEGVDRQLGEINARLNSAQNDPERLAISVEWQEKSVSRLGAGM